MFYSLDILTKKGPLAKVWLAATVGKDKVSKRFAATAEIGKICKDIESPPGSEPLALRLSAQLMVGVVRIYEKKCSLVLYDVSEALTQLRRSTATFKQLTLAQDRAKLDAITMQPRMLISQPDSLLHDMSRDFELELTMLLGESLLVASDNEGGKDAARKSSSGDKLARKCKRAPSTDPGLSRNDEDEMDVQQRAPVPSYRAALNAITLTEGVGPSLLDDDNSATTQLLSLSELHAIMGDSNESGTTDFGPSSSGKIAGAAADDGGDMFSGSGGGKSSSTVPSSVEQTRGQASAIPRTTPHVMLLEQGHGKANIDVEMVEQEEKRAMPKPAEQGETEGETEEHTLVPLIALVPRTKKRKVSLDKHTELKPGFVRSCLGSAKDIIVPFHHLELADRPTVLAKLNKADETNRVLNLVPQGIIRDEDLLRDHGSALSSFLHKMSMRMIPEIDKALTQQDGDAHHHKRGEVQVEFAGEGEELRREESLEYDIARVPEVREFPQRSNISSIPISRHDSLNIPSSVEMHRQADGDSGYSPFSEIQTDYPLGKDAPRTSESRARDALFLMDEEPVARLDSSKRGSFDPPVSANHESLSNRLSRLPYEDHLPLPSLDTNLDDHGNQVLQASFETPHLKVPESQFPLHEVRLSGGTYSGRKTFQALTQAPLGTLSAKAYQVASVMKDMLSHEDETGQKRVDPNASVTFADLASKCSRKVRLSVFFQTLVLASSGMITVNQSRPFGDIYIQAADKLIA